MATSSVIASTDEMMVQFHKQIAAMKVWLCVSVVVNLLLVGTGLYYFGFRFASRTIEARRIVLKDPSNHVLAIFAVRNDWGGISGKTYYPGIEFKDANREQKMTLFGTGIGFREKSQSSSLGFTGLDIADDAKKTTILINPMLLSYQTALAQFLLLPHPEGLNLTLGNRETEFGVDTASNLASMFVAGRRGELDINADNNGTSIQRYVKGPNNRW